MLFGESSILAGSSAQNNVIPPTGVEFGRTEDFASRGADLTGITDGREMTFSFWVYINEFNYGMIIANGSASGNAFGARIEVYDSVGFSIEACNSSNVTILLGRSGANTIPKQTWVHLCGCIDLTNSGTRKVYLNDEDITSSMTWTTFTNDDIDFTRGSFNIAKWSDTTANQLDGRLAEVFFDDNFIDLSDTATRRQFIGENGSYVSLRGTNPSGLVVMPMDNVETPYENLGTGGTFTENGTISLPGRGPNQYNAGATGDGTSDGPAIYLASDPTGLSDGKTYTISCWLKKQGGADARFLSGGQPNYVQAQFNGSNQFDMELYNSANGRILKLTNNGPFAEDRWYHFAVSFDLSDSAERELYIDGVKQSDANFLEYVNDTVDITRGSFAIGGSTSSGPSFGTHFDGEIADFWMDDTRIDLDANIDKFIDSNGKPVDLGIDGSSPSGVAPALYFSFKGTDAGTNNAGGSDFTQQGTRYGARSPSEFWANSAEFNGTNQYLSRASLTGVTDGGIFSIAFAANPDSVTGTQAILNFEVSGVGERFTLTNSTGDLRLIGKSSGGATLLNATVSSAFSAGSWLTGLIQIDLSSTSLRGIYLNGSAASVTWTDYTSGNIDFTGDAYGIAARSTSPGDYFDGKIGFLSFWQEYIDWSQEANRLLVVDAFGYPVDMGENGELVTGNVPLIYMNNDFHLGTNLGSGGNFTPQNTPTDGGFVKG